MKKLTVDVTISYEIEIDENNPIVKEYNSTAELIDHCAAYRFNEVLPVIGNGVRVLDQTVTNIEF
jgi:hypothetical protein